MVTPKTVEQLKQEGLIINREYDYNVTKFFNPWEDLMMGSQPIHQHLTTLNFIATEYNFKSIWFFYQSVLELGTQRGTSTMALIYAMQEIKGHLTSIDIAECSQAIDMINQKGLHGYWTFHNLTDDLKFPWKDEIDLLFIDTLHSYPQLHGELSKYVPFVKKGGFIIMHDTVAGYRDNMAQAIPDYFQIQKHYRWFNDCGLSIIRKR